MDRDQAFENIVQAIRAGESGLEIEHRLDGNVTGVDSIPKLIGEARKYAEEMQIEAFDAAVMAFGDGETHHEVTNKLIKCGFHPYDAEVVASRAKAKAKVEEDGDGQPHSDSRVFGFDQ